MPIPWIPNRTKPKSFDKVPPFRFWQPKLDGWRLSAYGQQDGRTLWFGRQMTIDEEFSPRINHLSWFGRVQLPPGYALDGELWAPGKPASYVSTALANRSDDLIYTVFDVPYRDYKVSPITDYKDLANGASNAYRLSYLKLFGGTPIIVPDSEGYVLIDSTGKRYKYKKEQTVDLIILGIKAGNGKYAGQVGALVCGYSPLKPALCSVSGMDDATRAKLSLNDIGRVVEIKYQYVGAQGGLRHPRFIRFRDDKPASQVVWPQD